MVLKLGKIISSHCMKSTNSDLESAGACFFPRFNMKDKHCFEISNHDFHMNMCLILDSAAIPLFPSSPSVFKPDELRQALMPTLEALYRQDPESLPFRQPVDPQLLGIPVRIRTSNKTNLVRACAGTHYATNHLALFSCSLIIIIIFLPLPPLFLSSACCCVHCVWMWERRFQACFCSVSVRKHEWI